jgi:hypothetical protein
MEQTASFAAKTPAPDAQPLRQVLASEAIVVGVEAVRVPVRVVAQEEVLRLGLGWEVRAVAIDKGGGGLGRSRTGGERGREHGHGKAKSASDVFHEYLPKKRQLVRFREVI